MSKIKDSKDTINPNEIKVPDQYQLMIISGVTKANIKPDQKKEKNKKKCRKPVDHKNED